MQSTARPHLVRAPLEGQATAIPPTTVSVDLTAYEARRLGATVQSYLSARDTAL